jgi:hypothetical protein
MSLSTWQETLTTQAADGPALTASVTETSLILGVNKRVIPPGPDFWSIGKKWRFVSKGRISNIVTSPGTLTLRIKMGATAIWNSGAIPLNIVAKTNVPWWLEVEGVVRSVGDGTLTTMMCLGNFQSESIIGSPASSAGGNGALLLPVTNPAVSTGFDSTAAAGLLLDFTAQWSASNANSIQTISWAPELLN